jgi:hypothetical protein
MRLHRSAHLLRRCAQVLAAIPRAARPAFGQHGTRHDIGQLAARRSKSFSGLAPHPATSSG